MTPNPKAKHRAVKYLDKSPGQKIKRSPDVSKAVSKLNFGSVEGESISQLEKTLSPLATSSRTSEVPLEKVEGCHVINVNESPAKKSKSTSTVPAVLSKLNFAYEEDERILPIKESQAPLDFSAGTRETTLVKGKESPVENLNDSHAKKSDSSRNASTVVSKFNCASEVDETALPLEKIEERLGSPTETVETFFYLHNKTTAERKENEISEETLVSQDLFTDGVFTDLAGLRTFPEEESSAFQKISPDVSEALPDSEDHLTAMRRMTLRSGGKMTYVQNNTIVQNNPELVQCFYCQKNNLAYAPLLKYKLDCDKHGGVGTCQPELDMEKCLETSYAQLLDLKFLSLQYDCFMCLAVFYDLRSFKCHLKCSHFLSEVTLCQKCLPLFQ